MIVIRCLVFGVSVLAYTSQLFAATVVIGGIPVDDSRPFIHHPAGPLWKATLAADTTIEGLPCRAGSDVEFFMTGVIHRCTLARDHAVNGVNYRRGTALILDHEPGTKGAPLVTRGFLAADTVLGGLPCNAGSEVAFSGRTFFRGTLASPVTYRDLPLKEDSVIELRLDGSISSAMLAADTIIGNIPLKAGEQIQLEKDGTPWSGTLSADTTIGGIPCKGGTPFRLDAGKVRRCVLAGPAVVGGINFPDGTQFEFSHTGALASATPPVTVTVQSFACTEGKEITFHPNGKIESFSPASPIKIGEKSLKVGKRVRLDKDGNLRP